MGPSNGRPKNRNILPEVNVAAKEYVSSNSTSAMFLGGHQKSWMFGQSQPQGNLSKSATQLPKNRLLREKSSNQPSLDTGTRDRDRALALSCQAPENSTSTPTRHSPPSRTNVGVPIQSDPSGAVPSVETVLPSPAPSDEHHSDSLQALDTENGRQIHNVHRGPPNTPPIAQMTGNESEGNEQWNRMLRDAELTMTPPASDTATPQNFQAPLNVSKSALASQSSNQDLHDKKRKRNDSGLRPDFTSREPVNAPPTTESSSNAAIAGPTWDAPSRAVMSSFRKAVIKRLQQATDRSGTRGNTEVGRLNLLLHACDQNDHAYLLLHQIYCMDLTLPEYFSQLNSVGFGNEHINGLQYLTPLLLPNFQHMELDTINWFARFPLPLEILLRDFQVYREALDGVKNCLAKMMYSWLSYRELCSKRVHPPLVEELVNILGIESLVLQSVAFRAIHKDMWSGDTGDSCFVEGEKLFHQSQRTLQQAPANRSLEQKKHDDQNLIIKYQRLHAVHTQHRQNSNSQASSTNMAHPPPRAIASPLSSSRPAQGSLTGPPNPFRVRWSTDQRRAPPPPNINTQRAQLPSTTMVNRTTPTVPSQAFSPDQRVPPLPHGQGIARSHMRSPPIQTPSTGPQSVQARRSSGNMAPVTMSPQSYLPSHFQSFTASTRSPVGQVGQVGQWTPMPNLIGPHMRYPPPSNGPLSNPQAVNRAMENPRSVVLPQAANYQLFLSPVGQRLSTTAGVNPGLTALHQYEARSPLLRVVNDAGEPSTNLKHFRCLEGVSVLPGYLKVGSRQHTEFSFHVDEGDLALLSGTCEGQNGSISTRTVRIGSRFGRIRCVVAMNGVDLSSDGGSAWMTANHTWPTLVTVNFNNKHVDIRKKIHYGKDLPIDVSAMIKLGDNRFSVSIIAPPNGDKKEYAIGLETIQLVDTAGARALTGVLSYDEARQRVLGKFQTADPEIEIVNQLAVINLCDPFTSRIWDVPMRGVTCRHDECFDLDTFLETRCSKRPDQPCDPDEFKCPICGADARPQSLIKDEFFEKLRTELAGMNRLDAKAIIMQQDGSWEVKEEEKTGESGDGSGRYSGRRKESVASAAVMKNDNVEVIEID
ncbi:MAG: hypothetical protein Q9182_003254 [Xanthomendoza sp. 2 TL-2023]